MRTFPSVLKPASRKCTFFEALTMRTKLFCFFALADLGRAKAFAESSDLREVMTKVGVVGRPDIYFLTD